MEPGTPLAGRDISFALTGLRPWQPVPVRVEFVDPRGEPAPWITEDEARIDLGGGEPVTKQTVFADETGQATWLRVATLDIEGVWTVRITLDGRTTSVSYPITQLQLATADVAEVGVELRRYRASVSDTYFSARVPAALAVDLQSHLAWAMDQLNAALGIRSVQIPDVYLAADGDILRKISDAIGVDLVFQDGFFKGGGARPGIYLRTDNLLGEVHRTLTHEYVHLALDEITAGAASPAWLNEGLATYLELELALLGQRPNASMRASYASGDLAKAAALSTTLLPLTSLESQRAWNGQMDQAIIRLQYSESYMAVRFLTETYGRTAALDVAGGLAARSTLTDALEKVTGLTYTRFRDDFVVWLLRWEDPGREAVRVYITKLRQIMDAENELAERRRRAAESPLSFSDRLAASAELLTAARALQSRLQNVSAPLDLALLHEEALVFLGTLVDWLTLERDYLRTGSSVTRTQANTMIPELNTRGTLVIRAVIAVAFNYNLGED